MLTHHDFSTGPGRDPQGHRHHLERRHDRRARKGGEAAGADDGEVEARRWLVKPFFFSSSQFPRRTRKKHVYRSILYPKVAQISPLFPPFFTTVHARRRFILTTEQEKNKKKQETSGRRPTVAAMAREMQRPTMPLLLTTGAPATTRSRVLSNASYAWRSTRSP